MLLFKLKNKLLAFADYVTLPTKDFGIERSFMNTILRPKSNKVDLLIFADLMNTPTEVVLNSSTANFSGRNNVDNAVVRRMPNNA